MSFEQNNPGMDQIINIKMSNKTHIWCPDKDIIVVGRMLCKHLIGRAFLHPILPAKVFSAFGQNTSGSGESVDQTLLNAFSFEIAIISASGKNVELSCWAIDKFSHCCEISYGVNLLFPLSSILSPSLHISAHLSQLPVLPFCSRSLSLKGQGSEWVCLKHGLLQSTGGVISTGKGNAPAPPAVGPDDFGRPKEGHLFYILNLIPLLSILGVQFKPHKISARNGFMLFLV